MNCCTATGQCDDSHNCPAHATKPIKASRCEQLGVYQGLGADQCPDCDSWGCEVPCAAEQPTPTRPLAGVTYPFAPGVIQGAGHAGFDDDDSQPLSVLEVVKGIGMVLASCAVVGLVLGYLVEKYA